MVDKLKKDDTIIVGPPAVIDTLNWRACLRHCGSDQRLRTQDRDGRRYRRRAHVQHCFRVRSRKTISPQGNRKRLHIELWRYACLFFRRHRMHTGDEALKNITVAFLSMNPPRTETPADAAACVKAFKPKSCILPLSRIEPGGILRAAERYARSGSADSEAGRRAVGRISQAGIGSHLHRQL